MTRVARAGVGTLLAAGLLSAFGASVLPAAPAAAGTTKAVTPADLAHQGMMPSDSPDARAVADPGGATSGTGLRAAAAADTSTFYGVDVASYQHPGGAPIDWATVAASGKAFAVVKATELTSAGLYTNPYYAADVAGARAAGMVTGAYAFAAPQFDATTQAKAFARVIGPVPSNSLPPVLDLETTGGLTPSQLVAWTSTFLTQLQAATGVVPMIYTSPGFWNSAMAGSTAFSSYPLWQATWLNSRTCSQPPTFGGWQTYTIWQFTDNAAVPGISGAVDGDCYQGSLATLATTARRAAPPGLAEGSTLSPGTRLSSPNGQYSLAMQADGNLVQYGNGRPLWWVKSQAPGSWLAVQTDGNVVLYTPSGSPVWATNTAGLAPVLSMQDNGNLVLRENGNAVWANRAPGCDILSAGNVLRQGWSLVSRNERYRAVMQNDGNFVIYQDGKGVWSTHTAGRGSYVAFQSNGDLVVYGAGGAIWATYTSPAAAWGSFAMQSDGNLVVYGRTAAAWGSGT